MFSSLCLKLKTFKTSFQQIQQRLISFVLGNGSIADTVHLVYLGITDLPFCYKYNMHVDMFYLMVCAEFFHVCYR